MFGSKKSKQERQQRILDLLVQVYPSGYSVPQLARMLNVPHSTILRDLPDLEDQGVLLDEADGILRIFKDIRSILQ